MHQNRVFCRIIGFGLSLIFTLIAYFIMVRPQFFHLNLGMALSSLFILAALQSVVQLLFFLDLMDEKGIRWNLAVFLSTLAIIFTIIVGTLWIMNHLNYNMMM